MATTSQWYALAQRLFNKGVAIFNDSNIVPNENGASDPKVVALCLLGRTLNNCRVTMMLLENHNIVEARTISRCCYENLFWAASLTKKREEFVKEMYLDDAANRSRRAGGLSSWLREQSQNSQMVEQLENLTKSLKDEHGRLTAIRQKVAAEDGGVAAAYVMYSELSNDAAHPSADSLSRHLILEDKEAGLPFTAILIPQAEEKEIQDTLLLLCNAVLGVCVATNEIIEGQSGGERLDAIYEDYLSFSKHSGSS